MGTIYTGKYKNHSIRIDNSIFKCKLFIDGEEKDLIQGSLIREGSNVLRSVIKDEGNVIPVEVLFDGILIERGTFHNVIGGRFVVRVDGEFFATGLIRSAQERKYGSFMKMSAEAAKNNNIKE